MSKFLITGGAGFIGGNFCHYMVSKYPNDEFYCLDTLTYAGSLVTLDSILSAPNFKFVYENICNKYAIFKLFEEEHFDYVINFAAETHVDKSIKNPNLFFKTNVTGTQVLLDACRTYGIKRFHQISTDEVYGDLPLEKTDLFFTEDSPMRPSNPYSASKASADLLVLSYHRTYGVPCTISRSSNNYGPYQFPEKLIPLCICNAKVSNEIPIYGSGLQVRDWIHVSDHCMAIDLILHHGKDGQIYNVCGSNLKTNLEIVRFILKKLNQPESLIQFVEDRPGHDLRYAMESAKITKELGWHPTQDFMMGLESTIDWYLNNPNWIRHFQKPKAFKIF